MSESSKPKLLSGLRDLVERYDLFLLDQYGVLHDGEAPYPGVADALNRLRKAGKRLCVLTNSGRSAAFNRDRLAQIGLDSGIFDRLVTSGDAAIAWLLRERSAARCYPVCAPEVISYLQTTGLRLVDDPEQADVLLLYSLPLPPEDMTEAVVETIFEVGLCRSLPLVCCNPDLIGPRGDRLVLSPGTVAGWYRERGGQVLIFGKPEAAFVRHALSQFPEVPVERAVVIGDTPGTDLLGANSAGVDGTFVAGGIHAADFASAERAHYPDIAEDLLRKANTGAKWLLPDLTW